MGLNGDVSVALMKSGFCRAHGVAVDLGSLPTRTWDQSRCIPVHLQLFWADSGRRRTIVRGAKSPASGVLPGCRQPFDVTLPPMAALSLPHSSGGAVWRASAHVTEAAPCVRSDLP